MPRKFLDRKASFSPYLVKKWLFWPEAIYVDEIYQTIQKFWIEQHTLCSKRPTQFNEKYWVLIDSIRIKAVDRMIENVEFGSMVLPRCSLVQGGCQPRYQTRCGENPVGHPRHHEEEVYRLILTYFWRNKAKFHPFRQQRTNSFCQFIFCNIAGLSSTKYRRRSHHR